MLDLALVPLAERSRDARITSGIIQLAEGAAFIVLGFVLAAIPGADGPGIDTFQYSTWFQGGYMAATGVTQLAWAPARERLSREYAAQPRATPHERRDRVRFGERALDEMAADGERRRYLMPIASALLPLGTLAVLYRHQIFDGDPMPEPPSLNYIVIGLVGLSIIPSLVSMFSHSDEERLRDRYRSELELLRQNAETPAE
jgi:hypothetical protein